MINLKKTLNQINAQHQPITITKYDNDTKIRLTISEPYSQLGLNENDWSILRSTSLINWNNETAQLNDMINDAFNVNIKYRYYNVVKALRKAEVIPTIVLSILCQEINEYSLHSFTNGFKPLYISEYFEQLRMLNPEIPRSLSPVTTYVIDLNEDINSANVSNGVNLILWDNGRTQKNLPNDVYGVKHAWDHYDYPHIHLIESFDHHRLLLLNAIKRTWMAMLAVTSGTKEVYTRVNYGYMASDVFPSYTLDEYKRLARLNYGTIIEPPYSYSRTRLLTLSEIEDIVQRALRCLRIAPTLNTIYMTSKQLNQERILGNKVILSRVTIIRPIYFFDYLNLYEQYSNIQLPTGEVFSPEDMLSRVEVSRTTGKPEYNTLAFQTKHAINPLNNNHPYEYTPVTKNNYETYLDIIKLSAKRQFLTLNILSQVSQDGYSIDVSTIPERAVAFTALNQNSHGINLNLQDQIPNSIIERTNKTYIEDYYLSLNILNEVVKFKEFLNVGYGSMNVAIISPDTYPTTYMQIASQTNLPSEVLSLDGAIGIQTDSLFTFNIMSANVLFITITERDYLNDVAAYELFLSDIKRDTYYSLELIDFSSENLYNALKSVLDVLKIAFESDFVKLQIAPLILNPLRVGIRVVFSLAQYPDIITSYSAITRDDLSQYARAISTENIIIDPIKSLTYSNKIIPRMGTQMIIRSDRENFQNSLGYMSSICRYVTSKCYSMEYPYYEMSGIVDQSRIVVMDRLQMFRANTYIAPEQLIPKEMSLRGDIKTARLTFFELVTQTDRMLLYLLRRSNNLLSNNLSDYGSAHFLNLCMTDNIYVMYDIDKIDTANVPGVILIQNVLEWGTPLPYIDNNDVLIYNSIFMNPKAIDDDMSVPIITMLRPVMNSKNIYFNLPVMTQQMYEILLPLNLVELINNRYYLKLSKYPSVPCLSQDELNKVLAIFPSPQYTVSELKPTLLDYYLTSRMIQRYGNNQVYNNAMVLHKVIPFFIVSS